MNDSNQTIESFCVEHKITKGIINNLREAVILGIANTSILKATTDNQHLYIDGEDESNFQLYKAFLLLEKLHKFAPSSIQSS